MEARIDQDPQLSSQLTLWNQQGSTVIRGDLLVIPLEDTLLFAEPIYLQAEKSPMPELRLVVLITQDRLAFGPRFSDALTSLMAGQAGSVPGVVGNSNGAGRCDDEAVDRSGQSGVQRLSPADFRRETRRGRSEAGGTQASA